MQLNPMSEIRAIAEACRRECLPASARLLWRVLFDCANDRQRWNADTNTYDWPDDFFPIDNAELTANSALEKRALLEARNRLKQIGAIDFKPGENNRRPAKYKILYLTGCRCKNVPAQVPAQVPANVPANVPAHDTAVVPISKDIDIETEKRNTVTLSSSSSSSNNAHARVAGRLQQTYIDAQGEERPCRFDGAFLASETVRRAVANRILLARFTGDYDDDSAQERMVNMLRDGMAPELMEDCIGQFRSLRMYMAHLHRLFVARGYERARDEMEMRSCLEQAGGNERLARYLYKNSGRAAVNEA